MRNKMKTKKAILGLWIGILFLSACARQTMIQKEPEFVFSYAENQSEDYPTTLGGYKFAELVEERTNGRIKVLVRAEGVLGDEKEVVEQVQFGGIDFARVSLAELSQVIPEWYVLQMPYLYNNSEHMWKVLDSEIGEGFLKASEEWGLIALSWYDAGARNFYNSVRPIKTLEDMEGLKIRVQESALMVDIVEALGAIPVPIPYDEVYASLERGKIDGAENNWPSYESKGHDKLAKYYTEDEHIRIPEVQLVSKVTWDKLSSKDQEIIRLCAQESALYERTLWAEREKQAEEIAKKKGVEVVTLSEKEKVKFKNAVTKVYEKYCPEYEAIIQMIIKKENE